MNEFSVCQNYEYLLWLLFLFIFSQPGGGSSGSPCSDTYRGTSAFSESETAALRDFISGLGGGSGVAMYSDYHAYSQYWMTPYGYTTSKAANYDQQVWLHLFVSQN